MAVTLLFLDYFKLCLLSISKSKFSSRELMCRLWVPHLQWLKDIEWKAFSLSDTARLLIYITSAIGIVPIRDEERRGTEKM